MASLMALLNRVTCPDVSNKNEILDFPKFAQNQWQHKVNGNNGSFFFFFLSASTAPWSLSSHTSCAGGRKIERDLRLETLTASPMREVMGFGLRSEKL